MKLKFLTAVTFITALNGLAGCTSLSNIHKTTQGIHQQSDDAERLLRARDETQPAEQLPVVDVISNAVWVDTTPIQRSTVTPPALNCPIAYSPKRPVRLVQVVARITSECNIPVRITTDAMQLLSGELQQTRTAPGGPMPPAQTAMQTVPPLSSMGGSPGAAGGYGTYGGGDSDQMRDHISVTYTGGPLRGLLDAVTAQLGLSWRYSTDDQAVTIYYLDTRTFTIAAIPTTTGIDTNVMSGMTSAAGTTGGSGGGSSTGGISGSSQSQSSTTVKLQSDVLKDLQAGITSLLTPQLGRMALSASTGTVTITDTPDAVARVGDYIKHQNTVLGRQVLLKVQVLSVSLTNADSLGLNWTALYQNLKNNYSIGLTSAFQQVAGSTQVAGSILQGNPKWSGSEAMIAALSQQGNVSTIYNTPITTLNLQPAPIQVAKSTGYLAKSELSQTAQVGSLQSLEGASVTYGFNLYVLPYILDDNKTVLLQFGMNLSDLDKLRTIGTSSSFIEQPDLSNSNFSQKVKLQTGQTLVMAGYQSNALKNNKQGVGDPNNILFGGGAGTDNRRQLIVILVTPVILR